MSVISSLSNAGFQPESKIQTSKAQRTDPRSAEASKGSAGIDKVTLQSGLSLEQIQELLVTEIGKKVDGMMSAAGIDMDAAAGLDWSADATAGRIFDMTTGLFGIWKQQHSKMSEQEQIDSFEKVIRTSVNKGASEAMSILVAGGTSDDVLSVSRDTMSILHSKYDEFFEGLRSGQEQSQIPHITQLV